MMPSGWHKLRWLLPLAMGVVSAATLGQHGVLDDGLESRLAAALGDYDRGQQIRGQQPEQAKKLFLAAARSLEDLIAAGIVNGRLEYNLGNAYFSADDVGRALLHYGRAKRLIPRDPLLTDNIGTARKRCLTTIEPKRGHGVLRSVFFWHYDTTFAGRATTAYVSFVGLWLMLTLRNFVPRRAVTGLAMVCGVLSLSLGVSLASQRWADRNAPAGVVLGMDVAVHKGPGATYQRQFAQPLQPGVEFIRRQSRGGWWNIELPDGQSGWIDADAAGLIPTD
jgi:hypothetical protein